MSSTALQYRRRCLGSGGLVSRFHSAEGMSDVLPFFRNGADWIFWEFVCDSSTAPGMSAEEVWTTRRSRSGNAFWDITRGRSQIQPPPLFLLKANPFWSTVYKSCRITWKLDETFYVMESFLNIHCSENSKHINMIDTGPGPPFRHPRSPQPPHLHPPVHHILFGLHLSTRLVL